MKIREVNKVMKKINWLMIGILIAIPVILIGIYVGDYFWVEGYKTVPVYYQHIFGNDLARYIIFDHICSGIVIGIITVIIEVLTIIEFKVKK